MALHDDRIDDLRRASDRRWRDEITATSFEPGWTRASSRSADPDRTALRIACLMDGLAVQTVLGGSDLTPGSMAREWLMGAAHELGTDPDALLTRARSPWRLSPAS